MLSKGSTLERLPTQILRKSPGRASTVSFKMELHRGRVHGALYTGLGVRERFCGFWPPEACLEERSYREIYDALPSLPLSILGHVTCRNFARMIVGYLPSPSHNMMIYIAHNKTNQSLVAAAQEDYVETARECLRLSDRFAEARADYHPTELP